MKVMVFEWLCGGGWSQDASGSQNPAPMGPADSMLRQGIGMLSAVAADFVAIGADVVVPLDRRMEPFCNFPDEVFVPTVDPDRSLRDQMVHLSETVDAALVIAPETGGCLEQVLSWLPPSCRSLGPDREFVLLAGDKHRLIEFLRRRDFHSVPRGARLSDIDSWTDGVSRIGFPIIVKPNDGAGSEGVQQFGDAAQWTAWRRSVELDPDAWRVERYVPGIPVSVSAIGSGDGFERLPPTGQRFDRHPIGHYVGAEFPLPAAIATRADRIAQRVLEALPSTRGYLGLDLVIAAEGSDRDCLVEVNPRITMSYAALRGIVPFNLASRMVNALPSGQPAGTSHSGNAD